MRRAALVVVLTMVLVGALVAGAFGRVDVRSHLSALPHGMHVYVMSCPSVHLCVGEGASPGSRLRTAMYSKDPGVGASWRITRDIAAGPSSWKTSYASPHILFLRTLVHGGCVSDWCYLIASVGEKPGERGADALIVPSAPGTRGAPWSIWASAYTSCPTRVTCFGTELLRSSTNARLDQGIDTIHL